MHVQQNVCWQHGSSFGSDNVFQQIGHCNSLFIFSITSKASALIRENKKHKHFIDENEQALNFTYNSPNNKLVITKW